MRIIMLTTQRSESQVEADMFALKKKEASLIILRKEQMESKLNAANARRDDAKRLYDLLVTESASIKSGQSTA